MDVYKLSIESTISQLKSRVSGLLISEVKKRQEELGKNVICLEKKSSFFKIFINQFCSYLAWLLIIVSGVAFAAGVYFHQDEQIAAGIIIAFIVLINALAGAYQDYKSEKSAEFLKSMLKNQAVTMRGGKKAVIDSEDLVPGDIIFLSEGNKVPADCRIIECIDLKVDESMLTGESRHVMKNKDQIYKSTPLAERKNTVYMNTYITKGAATCIVIETGKQTEIGNIAKSLGQDEKSLFLDEVDSASKKITYLALSLILVAVTVLFMKNHDWIMVFMMGSALIIGSVPEGLPAIVTFSLSAASIRLAKDKVIVKRKTVLETLGSVDVICSDKTGTLTENKMHVKKLYFEGKQVNAFDQMSKTAQEQFRNCALLCNEAKDTADGFIGEPEDTCLIEYFNVLGIDITKLKKQYPEIKLEPFCSENMCAISYNKVNGRTTTYTKGAPEKLLSNSKYVLKNGKIVRMTAKDRENISLNLKRFSNLALRNLAFTFSKGKNEQVFLGFLGIYDTPKKGIKETIKIIYDAGIEIKMITGDNIDTAKAIARECGFRGINAIGWDELSKLSETELKMCVKECNVFARMSPDYKLKIVTALQAIGKRVAITGDGINDVPALKQADVGIAVGKKSADIAKDAASLIIYDDDSLSSIVTGIKEGRTIFSNMRKVINYLLTANLAEVLVVFAGSLMGLVPILALQLLWVNFVTDIAPAMALGIDPSHKGIMKRKPTGKNEKIINKKILLLTGLIGMQTFVLMFAIFFFTYKLSGSIILAQTMLFTWLVLSHIIRIVTIRFDEKESLFNNKYLLWSLLIPVILQLIIIYTPLSKFFNTVHVTLVEWGVLAIIVLVGIISAHAITQYINKNLTVKERE